MIAWTIGAALESESSDKVIVSTDSEEIAKISQDYGAQTPFLRPKEFSDAYAIKIDVIKHALSFYADQNRVRVGWFCLNKLLFLLACIES